MPINFLVDTFEPPYIEGLFPSTLRVMRTPLVGQGLADFAWYCGHTVTLEHKSIDQAMQEMGGRLDTQLIRYTQHAEEVGLVIDGVALPLHGQPKCQLWKFNGFTWERSHHIINRSWEAFQSYLWRLDKEGITVYQAPTLAALCLAIASYVHNSLKTEHQTLKRFVKTKPIILEDKASPPL